MNLYARPSVVMADIAGVSPQNAELIPVYVRAIAEASREVDTITGRHFYTMTETRRFDGNGQSRLMIDYDLLSVTELLIDDDGDYTPELALAENTDYWLAPDNQPQKWYLDVHPDSSKLYRWPRGRRRVSIAGTWGYSDETESTGLTGTVADATATTITLSDGGEGRIDVGETLVIEDEQVYVTAVVAGTLTVERGVNGTTAAAHSAKTVYRRRYPREIEEAVKLQVVRLRWSAQSGHTGAVLMGDEQDIGGRFATSLFPRIKDLVKPYIVPRVA